MADHLVSLALVGLMGAGKSAVGRVVAQKLSLPFVDSDDEIATAAQMPIPEIFARYGEAFFRARETEVLRRLLEGERAVISTGGGVFTREENRALIRAHAISVWLKADVDLLWSRVRNRDTRPLLRVDNPYEVLCALEAERRPSYALADIAVEAEPRLSVEGMANKVIAALSAHEGEWGDVGHEERESQDGQ